MTQTRQDGHRDGPQDDRKDGNRSLVLEVHHVRVAAAAEALALGHPEVDVEHLLLGLLVVGGPSARAMTGAGADLRALRSAVAEVAEARGLPRAQVALAWVSRNPVVTAPIVGGTRVSHIEDAVASLDLELTDDEVAQLEEHYVPHAVVGY